MRVEKQRAWSYSAFNLYRTCPARYKYEKIDKLPVPPVPAFERGSAIHKDAELYLKNDSETLPETLASFSDNFKELKKYKPIVEDRWAFNKDWAATDYFDYSVYLRVVPDAVVVYTPRDIDIIDFKTGKKYDDNTEQLELFAAGAYYRFNKKPISIITRLWYLDTGEEVLNEYTNHDAEKFKDEWDKKVEYFLKDNEFLPKPNSKCKWCPFSKSAGGSCAYG